MILDYEIVNSMYTTEVPLTAGTTYTFKVQSRNDVGFSEFSAELAVFAAQVPDEPAAPTTTVSGDFVIIDWVEPNDQGADIVGYRV